MLISLLIGIWWHLALYWLILQQKKFARASRCLLGNKAPLGGLAPSRAPSLRKSSAQTTCISGLADAKNNFRCRINMLPQCHFGWLVSRPGWETCEKAEETGISAGMQRR